MTFPIESPAGSSPQQKYGSTITYAQRYSLIARLGLTSCDDDNDGNAPEPPGELVSEKQVRELIEVSEYVGANVQKFLALVDVTKFSEIKACDFERCIKLLQTKKNRT